MNNRATFNIRTGIRGILFPSLLIIVMLHWSCGGRQGRDRQEPSSTSHIDRTEHIAIVPLDAPAFSDLSREDQIAAYYLSKAVWAGRDVAYDQIHPKHLEIRKFLEDIALNISYGAPPYVADPFRAYLKLIWIHNGFYDLRSLNLIRPQLEQREFDQLMYLALSNSGGQLGTVTEINFKRFWIMEQLLNPAADPYIYARKFSDKIDLVEGSFPNFYQDVTPEEVTGFKHRFPQNSKLIKRKETITEWVYRTGDATWAPGPYASELAEIIEYLENARPYLPPSRVQTVDYLLEHFRTGDPAAYEGAIQARGNSDAAVDFIFGFNDRRFDPLHLKGLWTGLLFIEDTEAQQRLQNAIATILRRVEAFPPVARSELAAPYQGNIKAVQLLCATGCNGPLSPDIYTELPGTEDPTGQRLVFTNVLEARAIAHAEGLEAFAGGDIDAETTAELGFGAAVIRSVLDLEDWAAAVIPITEKLPPAKILRCALDELTILWLMRDPELSNTTLLPAADAADEFYRQFTYRYLQSLAASNPPGGKIQHAAIQVIGTALLQTETCFVIEDHGNGKTCRILDYAAMRAEIAAFAGRVADLIREGDKSAQQNFIATYFNESKIPDRGKRGRQLHDDPGLTETAFQMPLIEVETNPMGGIKKVYLEYPDSFTEAMFFLGGRSAESGKSD
jgi:hypothetical protein